MGKIDSVWDTVSNGCLNDSDKIFLYKGKIMFYLGVISFATAIFLVGLAIWGMNVEYGLEEVDSEEA